MMDEFLCHFNPNHDPKTGQFTSSGGRIASKIVKQMNKADKVARDVKQDIALSNGLGAVGYIASNSATKGYESLTKIYDTIDKLVHKMERELGEKPEGSAWKQFNSDRIALGENFIKLTKEQQKRLNFKAIMEYPDSNITGRASGNVGKYVLKNSR